MSSDAEAGLGSAADTTAESASARRVRTRADLTEFIAFAPRIARARGEENRWVPLFTSDIAAWQRGRGWFGTEVELWLLANSAGTTMARTICHRSPELAEKLGHEAGSVLFFGASEATDAEALRALIAFLEDRARELGCTQVFGPVAPLPNVTGGMITSGFDEPGFFDSAWNPAFHPEVFATAGYSLWGQAHTWEVDVAHIPAARATRLSNAEWAARGLRRRTVSRLRLGAFARTLRPTLNAAFAALPHYTEISRAQLAAQMSGLPLLLDPELVVDIVAADAPADAPTRCFALVIPDPIAILRRHDGRLDLGAGIDLVRTRITDAVLIIQGTDPTFQGHGLLSLVTRELNSALVARGYRRLRVTFIAEDNPASAAVFAKSGGRPLHGLAFVDKHLGDGAEPISTPTEGQPE